jgi:hypothetical protein
MQWWVKSLRMLAAYQEMADGASVGGNLPRGMTEGGSSTRVVGQHPAEAAV